MRHAKKMFFIVAILLSACASTQETVVRDEMLLRSSALTKLAAAMESHIRFGHPLAAATEADLLAAGTAHDPALLTNLGDYRIRVRADDRHAIALMCSRDGKRALLEDAGCTGEMDQHHWDKPAAPCEFTLTATSACRKK